MITKNLVIAGLTITVLALGILSVIALQIQDAEAKKNSARVTCINGSCSSSTSGNGDQNSVSTSGSESGSSVTVKQSNSD
jgi:hypothetical protein